MYKKGVTLISLVIVVLVLTIIISGIVMNASTITERAKIAKFAEDIKLIEDKINEYYITTGIRPVIEGDTYTAEQIISLNTSGKELELAYEIEKNNDENSNFYYIDFSSIGVEIEDREDEPKIDDVYVVSDKNNVYYLRGVEIGKEIYFSLINISNLNKLD